MATAASAADAPSPRPTIVTRPDWISKPTGYDVARLYPPKARKVHMNGAAVIRCGVTAEGALADCEVVEETPPDMGFGEAALKMRDRFRMRPLTKDGSPTAGGTVVIPIRFLIWN